MTEEQIRNYCQGNNQILADFYITEHDSLLIFLRRYTYDSEIAREVLFNIFVRFHELNTKQREKFNNKPKYFLGYIFKSLRNELITQQRKGKFKNMAFVEYDSTKHGESKTYSQDLDEFDKMLSILSKREKELVELYAEGYNNHEIADQKGISVSTVKNTLTSARNKLRKAWYIILIFACFI